MSIESQPLKCGNKIVLEAKIVSNLTCSTVVWEKDGQNIDKKEKFIKDHSNKLNPTLTICKATFHDQGKYSVIVANDKDYEKADIQIQIKGIVRYFYYIPTNKCVLKLLISQSAIGYSGSPHCSFLINITPL